MYNTTQLITMLPLAGQPERIDDAKLGVLFETSAGGLYNYYPHDQRNLNNYNVIVLGASGTGKSFLASTILMQLQKANVRVLGVDLGGSYKMLCEALGGSYITMDINANNQTVNPFYLPAGHAVEPADIERMTLFIEKLAVDPAKNETRLDKPTMNHIDEAIRQAVAKAEGKEFFLRDFKAVIEKFDAPLSSKLDAWVKGGRYAKLFDGPTQLDFNNKFCIFDMTEVKDSRDIAPLMLMSIINAINAMAKQYPNDPKVLLLDEAWFMLQDPIIGRFVAECFRTFRKLGVAVLGVSQGIEEWQRAESKSAILNNTSTFIVLRQSSPTAAAMAAEELKLNYREADIIKALMTIPGESSQALLHQSRADGQIESVVLVNRPSPLFYSMATTNPSDRRELARLKEEEGFDGIEAMIEFSKRFPRGTMYR